MTTDDASPPASHDASAEWVARHLAAAPEPTPEQLRQVRRQLTASVDATTRKSTA